MVLAGTAPGTFCTEGVALSKRLARLLHANDSSYTVRRSVFVARDDAATMLFKILLKVFGNFSKDRQLQVRLFHCYAYKKIQDKLSIFFFKPVRLLY